MPPSPVRKSVRAAAADVQSARMQAKPVGEVSRVRTKVAGRIFHFDNALDTPEITKVKNLCAAASTATISDNYTAFVDDANDYYNAVFVLGTDPARVRKFLRTYRPLFIRKAKIALVTDSRPCSRAKMLNTGFDDAFDLDETHHLEAVARLEAILSRVARSPVVQALDDDLQDRIGFYAEGKLLEREVRILTMLIANRGMPVRKQLLTASTKSPHRSISSKSLQVLISGLRRKLKPSFRISHGASGYSIEGGPVSRQATTS